MTTAPFTRKDGRAVDERCQREREHEARNGEQRAHRHHPRHGSVKLATNLGFLKRFVGHVTNPSSYALSNVYHLFVSYRCAKPGQRAYPGPRFATVRFAHYALTWLRLMQ